MDGNQIAEGLNKTLNQHYFTEEYRTNENGTGYAGIASGRIDNIYINTEASIKMHNLEQLNLYAVTYIYLFRIV